MHLSLLVSISPIILIHALRLSSPGDTVKHFTYFAMSGGGDRVIKEFSLSALSLCRLDPSVNVALLVDKALEQSAKDAASKIGRVCQNKLSIIILSHDALAGEFQKHGFSAFKHHSGIGGYSKLIAEKFLPTSVARTIVIDTDTIFNSNVGDLWSQFDRFDSQTVLLAKPLHDHYCIHGGHRINSGVVLMDLNRMREIGWTDFELSQARKCKHCTKGSVMMCGDQEFLSFACQSKEGACGKLDNRFHYDYCDNKKNWANNANDVVLYHFNCAEHVTCPGRPCKAAIAEWEKMFSAKFLFRSHLSVNSTRNEEAYISSDKVFSLKEWTWRHLSQQEIELDSLQ